MSWRKERSRKGVTLLSRKATSFMTVSNGVAFCVHIHVRTVIAVTFSVNERGEGEGPMAEQKDILILIFTSLTPSIM